jgi:hypothetical protein
MTTTFVISISVLFAISLWLAAASSQRRGRETRTPTKVQIATHIFVACMGVVAAYGAAYSLGYQAGSDRALRDNRADTKASLTEDL